MRTKIFSGDHRVTSPYGWRKHPITGERSFHNGVDFSMITGTKLLVPDTFNGAKVRLAQADSYGGKYIQLRRSDGKGCYYLHVSSFKKKVGDTVKTGDVIALSGNTGNSTAAHTHFGVQKTATVWKSHEDPMPYLELDYIHLKGKLEQLADMNIRDSKFNKIGTAKKGSVCLIKSYYKINNGYHYYNVAFGDKVCYIADSKFNKTTTKAVTNLDSSKVDTCQDKVIALEKEIKSLEDNVGALNMQISILEAQKKELQEANDELKKYKEYYEGLSVYLVTKI